MTKYPSARAIKFIILTVASLNFVVGAFIFIQASVQAVGAEGFPLPYLKELPSTSNSASSSSKGSKKSSKNRNRITITTTADPLIPDFERYSDRFPSIGSTTTLYVFAIVLMFTSALGIIGVHLENSSLLRTFGYTYFIGSFTKLLFIVASTQMHAFRYDYNPLGTAAVISLFIAIIEIVLGLLACQLAKIAKRGEFEIEIPPLPSAKKDSISLNLTPNTCNDALA